MHGIGHGEFLCMIDTPDSFLKLRIEKKRSKPPGVASVRDGRMKQALHNLVESPFI
jgi:hypothetical protein